VGWESLGYAGWAEIIPGRGPDGGGENNPVVRFWLAILFLYWFSRFARKDASQDSLKPMPEAFCIERSTQNEPLVCGYRPSRLTCWCCSLHSGRSEYTFWLPSFPIWQLASLMDLLSWLRRSGFDRPTSFCRLGAIHCLRSRFSLDYHPFSAGVLAARLRIVCHPMAG